MEKNLSFNKKSTGNFYTRIQKKALRDSKKKSPPYQYIEFNSIFIKNISKRIKKNAKILDVGCGYLGGFLPMIQNYNNKYNLFACDINKDTEKNLKENYKYINFKNGSCLKLPYKSNSFDLIICYGVIHHTHNWRQAINEIKRVVKKDGYIFLGTYAFYNSVFEYLIRFCRFFGKIIKYKYFDKIANIWPLFNRFFMDHTYVPILYLINKKLIIDYAITKNLKLIFDKPSSTDFFQKNFFLGKFFTNDGLLRLFFFKKK